MDFVKKNWIVLVVALLALVLLMRRRGGAAGMGLVASSGTYVPGTEQELVASDGLTHQTGETAGPTEAARSGRGHF